MTKIQLLNQINIDTTIEKTAFINKDWSMCNAMSVEKTHLYRLLELAEQQEREETVNNCIV